jgi:hypothetical protein
VLALLLMLAFTTTGCQLIPDVAHQPVVHNPFPQLSRVAVAPFFNHSDDETVDGRQFALAYFAELQAVPGFEVVPLGVVEEAMLDHQIVLNRAGEARRLAKVLGVDAIVIGAVTDFSPYYPPRCGVRTEWYSANPGFHEIPPGYGLPWGTPEEEFIPAPLVFEAEMALAREQMKTQTPACAGAAETAGFAGCASDEPMLAAGPAGEGIPPNWPDERGFIPPGPQPTRPPCVPHDGPVMTHTRIYHGNDSEFSEALASYYHFRDDARFGGWQSYLQRSDDFVRFCCHLHISEMLTARGGGGETRVVWRWSDSR